MVGRNGMLIIQFQSAHKCGPQFRQEMKRTAQECYMSPDRFAAGQSADRLVDDSLEDGCGQVLFGSPFIDQRLNIRFCKYTTAGGDGIERLVIFGIFIQTRGVCLQQRSHLIDERAGTAGADAVHTLFYISAFKINDLGVFAAKLDGYVGLRRIVLEGSGNCDYFLYKGDAQMFGQSKASGSCNNRRSADGAQFIDGASQKIRQGFLDIGKMSLIIRKKHFAFFG